MSAFQNLASPAPQVEAAEAESAFISEDVKVEPAKPSEDARVEPAMSVEPASTVDDPHKFAPPITKEEVSRLSVAGLRGSGSEFESKGAVIQGGVPKNFLRKYFPLCFDERDFISFGEVARYVFVKGNFIFIYDEATSPAPLYAILLGTVRAEIDDPKNPHPNSYTISPRANNNEAAENLVTILLIDIETNKIAYQVTFDTTDDKSTAKRFLDIFNRNAKHYGEIVTASVVDVKEAKKSNKK